MDPIVKVVDEKTIRGLSAVDEEFSNYAIHSDVKDVPPNEIWISSRVGADEKDLLLEEAKQRMDLEAAGVDSIYAYREAEKSTQIVRQLLHGKAAPSGEDLDQVKDPGGSPVTVKLVDGDRVRDKWRADFVEGSHGYHDKFIPKNEVWIDKEVPEDERQFIIAHELAERWWMKQGMTYNKAHAKAARLEWTLRQKNQKGNKEHVQIQ